MNTVKIYAVAVDGPSGAGKSTLSRAVAAELGLLYVDTGAIYRSVGLYTFRRQVNPEDAEAVSALLPQIALQLFYGEDGLQHMLLNGEDVTEQIRLPQISLYASQVSAIPQVRSFLLQMQRELAQKHSVIMDGRDIGTVVLPEAEVKIFLTASSEERARRRYLELIQRGMPQEYETVLREVVERDQNDTNRKIAPLRPAEDAVLLDTTGMDFEESKRRMVAIIREKVPQ